MARRGQGLESPAAALYALAALEDHVGSEHLVQTLFGSELRGMARHGRLRGPDPRARARSQRMGEGRMVQVRMSDQDVRNALALKRAQQGLEMRVQSWAGVDHRLLALADDVGPGAGVG